MYGKIFSSIFDSTLVADGGWLPTYIFMSMIAIADKDGVVAVAPKALFRKLGFREYDCIVSFDQFEKALDYLETEDSQSNSSLEGGRRLIPMSETSIDGNRGWLIVNYMVYRKKASKAEPKGSSTERVRKFREKRAAEENQQLSENVTVCNGNETGIAGHTDTDTDTDTDNKKNTLSPPQKKKKGKSTPITLRIFLQNCKDTNEPAVPGDHAAFKHADREGMDREMVVVAWYELKNQYLHKDKKYADWRSTLANAVRNNWFNFWCLKDASESNDGRIDWTGKGLQARRAMRNANQEAENAVNSEA